MARTILVVDDEKAIVDILSFNLKKEGYTIVTAYDGGVALEQYKAAKPDLIMLDVMLPVHDGFEVCRRIRETDRLTPIIMLTARDEETDKVLGLEIGADDYITKPFSIREVQARVKANMRRTEQLEPVKPQADESSDGGLVIDTERFDVYIDGKEAGLTTREFEIIRFLRAHPGKVISREELMREVWQYDFFGDLRAVDVAVRRLREKVEENPGQPRYIITKRGAGYYYEP